MSDLLREEQWRNAWKLSSALGADATGDTVSRPNFNDAHWAAVSVPGTIVSAQVEAGTVPDPYTGTAMAALPGYKLGRESHMAQFRMPDGSPYIGNWWYRRCFFIAQETPSHRWWLYLDGLNYSGTLWVNGRRVAGPDVLAGPYRRHRFDITRFLRIGEENAVAIEVASQRPDDLGLTFIDWSPTPPDDETGLWRPVRLRETGPLAIADMFLRPAFKDAAGTAVDLTIEVTLENPSEEFITGVLRLQFGAVVVQAELPLDRYETKTLVLSPDTHPELALINPRLWWPYQLGTPHLHDVSLSVFADDQLSDEKHFRYGLRNIESYYNDDLSRAFRINGHDVLIRGSAWKPDLLLREDERRDEIDMALLKHMHFNAVRFEGFLGSDHIWDVCDREGIMVLAGWPCCNHFEHWDEWKEGDLDIACRMMHDQLLRLRNRGCLIAWFYGSDFAPPILVEKAYLQVLETCAPGLPHFSSASHRPSELTGDSGVKMTGPYSYEPPIHWYQSETRGRAHGFNTETGPDCSIPRWESIIRFIPEEQRHIGSPAWMLHTGLGGFLGTKAVEESIRARFGQWNDLEEFSRLSQVAAYEAWRAMYEAHARNWPAATGVIGWMQNASWPSLLWQLYDWYFQPTGGFYGSKHGCAPLHAFYAPDTHGVYLSNMTAVAAEGYSVRMRRYTLDGTSIDGACFPTFSSVYCCTKVGNATPPPGIRGLYFLVLTLEKDDAVKDRNVYWLSADTADEVDLDAKEWFHQPMKRSVALSPLRKLPQTDVVLHCRIVSGAEAVSADILLENRGHYPAFGLFVDIVDDADGRLIAPVYFSDNCIVLMPAERLVLSCRVAKADLPGGWHFRLSGWNVAEFWSPGISVL